MAAMLFAGPLAALLAGCAAGKAPDIDAAPSQDAVEVITVAPYKMTSAEMRDTPPLIEKTSRKSVARVSSCIARAWRKQGQVETVWLATGRSIQLSGAAGVGLIGLADVQPLRRGSTVRIYKSDGRPDDAPDAVLSATQPCL